MSAHHGDYIWAQSIGNATQTDVRYWYVTSVNNEQLRTPNNTQIKVQRVGSTIFGLGQYDKDLKARPMNKSMNKIRYEVVREVDGKSTSTPVKGEMDVIFENNKAHVKLELNPAGEYTVTLGRSKMVILVGEDIRKPDPAVTTTSKKNKNAGTGVPRA
ncbi:hypothetical protein UA08_09389 [Talaromyces atroroseus]|uniref:Uncharacterized protein n=1 Tax=Talaromyces atroroseus TaxID=1441469 RepID=A0A1Q5Q662_TALAT|nr:hypothetical protein UA08_09389 [Talaromyces atroroseus]OKL55322.1 hypothetical protein UA08_09389 [Talaromyces atroroseus]